MEVRILFIAFIIACATLRASDSDSSLVLIPQPKKIEVRKGEYNFSRPYSIRFTGNSKFYSELLSHAVEKKFKTKPSNSSSAENKIELRKVDSVELAKITVREKLPPPFALGAEGYILVISPKYIQIIALDDAGIFYGVQTLIQLVNANPKNNSIPCMIIYDKPDMPMRGWQDDISRGPIPTMNFLKEEIRRMASFKLNTFTLYTEHVFKLRKHPDIAPADGITTEEIKELTEFAKNYHVDIIGNFQSFGHFNNILKVPGYESLGEDKNTLSPAKEKSYKFLEDAYSEIVPAYESKYFHINCDEVNLGDGPSKAIADSIGVEGVYAYHINRINELLKPYGKKIMMWGDIAVHNPKITERLPKDMLIVSWGYGPMESMDEEILPFVKSGFEFIVAPGVSCWSRIYPDMSRAVKNIYNYLRDGYKNKALGFINTTWDDSGQNLFNNNWYSLVWGADCGWNAPLNEPAKQSEETRKDRLDKFNRTYNKIYFDTDKDITSLLFAISDLRNGAVKNCLSDGSIWNPLLPDYNVIPENYERDNLNLIDTINSLSAEVTKIKPYFKNRESEYGLLSFVLRQSRLVAGKNLLGIKLKNYILSDSIKDIDYFQKDLAALSDTIESLKPVYGKLWKLENRNWWLDTIYSFYDSFSQNLNNLKDVCIIKASDKLIGGKREIRLRSAFNNLPVYYTTDGTQPTISSQKYSQPIFTDTTVCIQARVFDKNRMYAVESDSLVFHKGIVKLYRLNCKWSAENPTYAARGELGLLDGRRGSRNNFNDGRWQAYLGRDIDIELDFDESITISKITIGFAQLVRYGILYPKQIDISTSSDANNYTLVKTTENTIEPNTEVRSTHDYTIPLDGVRARYIKIVAKNSGLLPEWHHAKGTPSWLFADEIIVE